MQQNSILLRWHFENRTLKNTYLHICTYWHVNDVPKYLIFSRIPPHKPEFWLVNNTCIVPKSLELFDLYYTSKMKKWRVFQKHPHSHYPSPLPPIPTLLFQYSDIQIFWYSDMLICFSKYTSKVPKWILWYMLIFWYFDTLIFCCSDILMIWLFWRSIIPT